MVKEIVDVNGLSRSFGGKSALDGVSFHASAGQVYGLVGANGAGKTTLLKHLLVRRGYQRSRVRFGAHFDHPPVLETALAMEGGGRTWSVVHSGSLEQFHHSVLALGGEVIESRDATLEEIFLARAGRSRQPVEVA